jgi:photosystem II stability/assembly factor-like uncharacterized protein
MNRAHNERRANRPSVLLISLCAVIFGVLVSGAALAATGTQPAKPQPDRSWESYYGVAILPNGRTVVVGDKGVVMVSDGRGRTWTRQHLKKGIKYFDLYSVAFTPDGSRGWLVGDNSVIFRSDDRGMTWQEQSPPSGLQSALLKVAAIDSQRACAVGEHGAVLCTSDGGVNWALKKFSDLVFFDVAFPNANDGWAVGEFGTILQTADGGRNWKIKTGGQIGQGDPYFAVAFEGSRGLAVGLIGNAVATTDSGQTWKPEGLAVEHKSLYTVAAMPSASQEFYTAGETGTAALIKGGEASLVQSGVSNSISEAVFSPRFGMAVGLGGTLLRSDDGGSHWHSVTNANQALTRAQ